MKNTYGSEEESEIAITTSDKRLVRIITNDSLKAEGGRTSPEGIGQFQGLCREQAEYLCRAR